MSQTLTLFLYLHTCNSYQSNMMQYFVVHKLEVTSLQGMLGETLSLISRVEPSSKATEWLTNLEQNMQTSLNTSLEACIRARIDDSKCNKGNKARRIYGSSLLR